jgi:hypothetical protein
MSIFTGHDKIAFTPGATAGMAALAHPWYADPAEDLTGILMI